MNYETAKKIVALGESDNNPLYAKATWVVAEYEGSGYYQHQDTASGHRVVWVAA